MNVINFESIDSTNKYLKENHENLENLSFVCAKYQNDGKGRENRNWISPNDENLLFSFLVKDDSLLKEYNVLSIGTATLIGRFLELLGLKNVMIKWPNDVYVNGKKICGILLEGNIKEYIVIGVGLNVNQIQFDGDYRIPPTSIQKELRKPIDLESLKILLFEFLIKHINQKTFKSNSLSFYRKHDYLFGNVISINNYTGKVAGITNDFELIIDNRVIDSGEVI